MIRFLKPCSQSLLNRLSNYCRGLILISLLSTSAAWAHKGSDAYLDVQQLDQASQSDMRSLSFTLSVAIKDLDAVLPLDANSDGKVSWGELKTVMPDVLRLFNQTAQLDKSKIDMANTGCSLDWKAAGVERRGDGAYIRATALANCALTQAVAFKYTLLAAQDANHRLLLAGKISGKDFLSTASPLQTSSVLLSPALDGAAATPGANTNQSTPLSTGAALANSSQWSTLKDYFLLGVHHLLEGYDHLAFLLALVLPLQLLLRWPGRKTSPELLNSATGKRNVWRTLLLTITAFTVGHSITLILATLGLTSASPSWVEPMIAASIAVTAFLNIRPVPWVRVDVLALLFGMIHGYGFAGLMLEAAAPTGLLPWALAGFNLGVEAGQLIAVSAWVLVSQPLLNRSWYAPVVVRGGSALLILLATWWFYQRVF
jgi:hydrogenase/urease accessory protein HupE